MILDCLKTYLFRVIKLLQSTMRKKLCLKISFCFYTSIALPDILLISISVRYKKQNDCRKSHDLHYKNAFFTKLLHTHTRKCQMY